MPGAVEAASLTATAPKVYPMPNLSPAELKECAALLDKIKELEDVRYTIRTWQVKMGTDPLYMKDLLTHLTDYAKARIKEKVDQEFLLEINRTLKLLRDKNIDVSSIQIHAPFEA